MTYPRFPDLVIAEAQGDARTLNQEVWRHEKQARSRAMPLVIEIHARSVLASRRLTEWWQSGDQLMQDTLGGVYLLRIDLQRFGPEAVLKLTPYAVAGAPLFVGWNAVGQVCSRTQFHELTREAFALPLSAFVEDVLRGQHHSLNPTPSLGNAERTREALALKRASLALSAARHSEPVVGLPSTSEPSDGFGVRDESLVQPVQTEALPPLELPPAVTDSPRVVATDSATVDLDLLLERARSRFGLIEDKVGSPLRLTLDDLRTLDDYLAERTEDERQDFARDFGAVLAVYVGDTIRERAKADWALVESRISVSALELRGDVLGEGRNVKPMEWVVEILGDSTRSLYGQALAWCRIY